TVVPRSWRLRLPVLWAFRWRLPHLCRLTLPLAVILNRFLALLFVFIFGMVGPLGTRAHSARVETKRNPQFARGSRRRAIGVRLRCGSHLRGGKPGRSGGYCQFLTKPWV